jgi:hypothetical protein
LSLATDNEGSTVFNSVSKFNKIEVFQGIFNLAKENQKTEKLKKFSLATEMREAQSFIRYQNSIKLRYFRGYLIWQMRI